MFTLNVTSASVTAPPLSAPPEPIAVLFVNWPSLTLKAPSARSAPPPEVVTRNGPGCDTLFASNADSLTVMSAFVQSAPPRAGPVKRACVALNARA
jgi:hypothetical protein